MPTGGHTIRNGRQTSAATAVRVGALSGLVVCFGSTVPIWVAGADWRDAPVGPVAVVLPILWVAVSAAAGSYCAGSSIWGTLRVIILGVFGWIGLLLGVFVLVFFSWALIETFHPGMFPKGVTIWPTMWQWLIFWACVGVPGGAYLGVAVAKRAFEKTREEAVSLPDAKESLVGYDWVKVSRRCGVAGLLMMLLHASTAPKSLAALGSLIFIAAPALLVSTVAIVVGLWTRTTPGWILGLLSWAWFLLFHWLTT